jgi:hypothetical protein
VGHEPQTGCDERSPRSAQQLIAGVAAARRVAGIANQALDLLDRTVNTQPAAETTFSSIIVEPKSSTP